MSLAIVAADESHLVGLTEIYNHIVLNSTAIYTTQTTTTEQRGQWLAARRQQGWPVWVAVQADRVLGFASFSEFRGGWPGYRFTVEHSVHVAESARGGGVGSQLMRRLIDSAIEMQLHVMIGAVDADNTGSIRFHQRLGFREVARLPEVGHKFGRWLDLVLMQLTLPVSDLMVASADPV